MAGFKEIVVLFVVALHFLNISCNGLKRENTAKHDQGRKALLKTMMYLSLSQLQSHSQHVRIKRGAKRNNRKRPNWKDHRLYPLYPIDFEVCEDAPRESKKGLCKSWAEGGYCNKRNYKRLMKKYCKKTCQMCKAPSPVFCEGSKFGCCWDNKTAKGPNGEGCLPCFDVYQITCPQFRAFCNRHGRNGRFIRYHCFQTCGRCAMQKSHNVAH